MKAENILILTGLFGNNRQGYDIADVLRRRGHRVRLIQYAGAADAAVGNLSIKYVRPHGLFSKFHVAWNLVQMVGLSLFCKKEIVVCIGAPLLLIGGLYKFICRTKLVYYALEYGRYSGLNAWIVKKLVDRYIDVEENRHQRVFSDLGIAKPALIVHNFPALHNKQLDKGRLRSYLAEHHGFKGDERLVVYAGSYQRYSCLENVVRASSLLPDNYRVILMIAWGLPKDFTVDGRKCLLVPPAAGIEFFEWLADADCALLPYESATDFNVQNCSPQKLFDCYMVGVPYVASDRPLISKTLAECPQAGVLCDFTDVQSIAAAINRGVALKSDSLSSCMHDLYRKRYNYECHAEELANFVCGVKE